MWTRISKKSLPISKTCRSSVLKLMPERTYISGLGPGIDIWSLSPCAELRTFQFLFHWNSPWWYHNYFISCVFPLRLSSELWWKIFTHGMFQSLFHKHVLVTIFIFQSFIWYAMHHKRFCSNSLNTNWYLHRKFLQMWITSKNKIQRA